MFSFSFYLQFFFVYNKKNYHRFLVTQNIVFKSSKIELKIHFVVQALFAQASAIYENETKKRNGNVCCVEIGTENGRLEPGIAPFSLTIFTKSSMLT